MDKKEIQKNRVMSYFINAADEIIREEGIESVTIRRVSDMAGFNSATLYNYFENLDHLLFLASMKTVQEYPQQVLEYIKDADNIVEKNLLIWECFCKLSFKRPKIYYRVFFPKLNRSTDKYVKEYYKVYPKDEIKLDGVIPDFLQATDLNLRNYQILEEGIKMGWFDEKNHEEINDMTMLIYKGMLMRVMDSPETIDIEEAVLKTVKYVSNIYEIYRKK